VARPNEALQQTAAAGRLFQDEFPSGPRRGGSRAFGDGGLRGWQSRNSRRRGAAMSAGAATSRSSSQMTHLRPECSHWLYGNPPCVHEFAVRPRVRRRTLLAVRLGRVGIR
jgi:hypothetical protein